MGVRHLAGKERNVLVCHDGKGAWKYNPQDNTFKHYTNKDGTSDKTPSQSISSNSISSLMQDSKGNVWLSTDRGGLCRYNPKEDNFTRFSVEEGMPDNVAYKVLEDDVRVSMVRNQQGIGPL